MVCEHKKWTAPFGAVHFLHRQCSCLCICRDVGFFLVCDEFLIDYKSHKDYKANNIRKCADYHKSHGSTRDYQALQRVEVSHKISLDSSCDKIYTDERGYRRLDYHYWGALEKQRRVNSEPHGMAHGLRPMPNSPIR